jgi:hypothetical protein
MKTNEITMDEVLHNYCVGLQTLIRRAKSHCVYESSEGDTQKLLDQLIDELERMVKYTDPY